MAQDLTGRDLVSILDFSSHELEDVFTTADRMQRFTRTRRNDLKGKVMSTIFFEPSTRTRLSFESAMHRLGGSVIGFAEPGTSSVAKGETLADTIRMVESYSDVILLRHSIEGSAKFAAEISQVPVINGGDGSQHHPSQTLTDLYTIRREFGSIEGRRVMIVGDLKHTRSASSLAYGLSLYRNIKLFLVSPKSLQMRPEILDHLDRKHVKHEESENLRDFISDVDVTYVTRLQKERFSDAKESERLKGSYVLTKDLLANSRRGMIVMHHLPRIDEIPLEVDYTPNARYFEQAANGVPVRMAFLYLSIRNAKFHPLRTRGELPPANKVQPCQNPKCITNQLREPIAPKLVETHHQQEKVLQCEYCGRYTGLT